MKGTDTMSDIDLTITETAVPTITRKREPNKYLAHAKRLADNRKSALTFEVPAVKGESDADRDKRIASVTRVWYEAGKEVGVTIRAQADASNPRKITVWAVDRIERKRKTATETAGAPAAE